MLNQNNNTPTSEDLKTDSIPDSPSEREATDDQENNASLLLPPKEDIVNDERETIPKSNHKTYLKLPKDLPFATKKKPSPKTSPKPSKSKKEKKKSSGVFSEPSTVVYQISNSSGIHIGPDVNLTIVQNSPSAKAQPAPKENKTIRGLLESKLQVTREHIRLVAPHVGEHWREVGRLLNLTDGRLEQIEQDRYKEGMREVVYHVLLEWIRVNASDARLGDLTDALWKSAEYSAVTKLAEWAKESSLFD